MNSDKEKRRKTLQEQQIQKQVAPHANLPDNHVPVEQRNRAELVREAIQNRLREFEALFPMDEHLTPERAAWLETILTDLTQKTRQLVEARDVGQVSTAYWLRRILLGVHQNPNRLIFHHEEGEGND